MRTLVLLCLSLILSGFCAADTVVLKDQQVIDCQVQGFDHYTLDVQTFKGKVFHIPWGEVQSVSQTSRSLTSSELSFITPNSVEVTTFAAPLSESLAFQKALYPGFFIHGWGHHFAHDEDRYYTLVAGELLGVATAGFGLQEYLSNANSTESRITSQSLSIGGLSIFAATWVYDLAFAGSAVRHFNQAHDLVSAQIRVGFQFPVPGCQLALNW
jgi:hypothetical protein